MKRVIELYRKYGVSQATLRQLASGFEGSRHSEKRKYRGKNVWFLDESIVKEYMAGYHRELIKPEKTTSDQKQIRKKEIKKPETKEKAAPNANSNALKIYLTEIDLLKEKLEELEVENSKLHKKIEGTQKWSSAWKKMAKTLKAKESILTHQDTFRWNHRSLNLDKVEIHYVQHGDGSPVILIHSVFDFWYSWRHQIPFLSQEYNVIAPDLRGTNKSSKPSSFSEYFLYSFMQDIKNLISKYGEKAHIIGHGFGGWLAWMFASTQPQMVDKLVIMNCPHPFLLKKQLRFSLKNIIKNRYLFYLQIPWVPKKLISRNVAKYMEKIERFCCKKKNIWTKEDFRKYYAAFRDEKVIQAHINYCKVLFKHIFETFHPQEIDCRTLFLWGEDSFLDESFALDTKLYGKNIEMHFLEECGYMMHQEKPEMVNRVIERFLKA